MGKCAIILFIFTMKMKKIKYRRIWPKYALTCTVPDETFLSVISETKITVLIFRCLLSP